MWPLFLANLKMLVRNRQALFWALIFPLLFVTVFGLFDVENPGKADMAVVDHAQTPLSQQLVASLEGMDFITLHPELKDETQARRALEAGDIEFVLVIPEGVRQVGQDNPAPVPLTLLYDEANVQENRLVQGVLRRFVDEVNLSLAGVPRQLTVEGQGITARRIGYFDFLVPGIVGMGVMTFSIIYIATSIAHYREQKILKRIQATPLKVYKFFVAQVLAHLLLAVAQAVIILAVGVMAFGAHIYGNYLWLVVLVMLANLVFLNIGFIVAGLARGVNAANGLANVIAMPMMFFSGTFFPTDALPPVMRHVAEFLPLTPLLDAMRRVALDAEPIWATGPELALLGGWIVVTSLLAVRLFRFS